MLYTIFYLKENYKNLINSTFINFIKTLQKQLKKNY